MPVVAGPAAVVIVEVRAEIVVPGTVVAAVDVVLTVLPETRSVSTIFELIVLGGMVVPEIVVVMVISSPSAVSGITFPMPDPVNCVGRVRVDVFGFDGEEADP